MDPLFTIIIPVYNAEKWLERCISSILKQSFKSYEIIVVNDGSTDRSNDIIRNISQGYRKFLIINQENSGVSAARNAGLKRARGEWIWFIDADDYIHENSLLSLSKLTCNNDCDLIIFNTEREGLYPIEINALLQDHYFKYHLGFEPWNKIYRRDTILKNQIFFDSEEKIGEDLLFNIIYYHYCKALFFYPNKLYEYVENDNSAMHKDYSDRLSQQVRLYLKIITFYGSYLTELNKCILFIMHWVSGVNQTHGSLSSKQLRDLVKENFKKNTFGYLTWRKALNTFFHNEHSTPLGKLSLTLKLFRHIIFKF